MAMRNNFGVFILTHGRPDRVITYETIRSRGYTGPIYIVCDDEDKKLDEYRAAFDNVLVFSKAEIAKTFDAADNSKDRRVIIYARNACFEFARELGLDYFIELDDDYTYFKYRFLYDDGIEWGSEDVKDLDSGTYIKSFYTVMFSPSSVKVSLMGTAEARLHHSISWEHTVPQIIREEHKKTQ